jgi:hypothetical protein
MKTHQAKKLINNWLKEQGRTPLLVKQSYCEFAGQLSREMSPRHGWRHFEDKREAEKFIKDVALALGLQT